jgi:predicted dehydrogenase/nucleoside-diphosphate-sugar epimerase
MGNKKRVGIIGAGYISDYHLEILGNMREVEVVGIFDTNERRAREAAKKWQLSKVYSSLEAFLSCGDIEVAHILTPPPTHEKIARKCLERGMNVFVEKPLSLSAEGAEHLVAYAKNHGLEIGVNHNFIFTPVFQELLADLRRRKLGEIKHMNYSWHLPLKHLSNNNLGSWIFRRPTNILYEWGPHMFSQIASILGDIKSSVAEVSGEILLPTGERFYKTWNVSCTCQRGSVCIHMGFGEDYPVIRIEVIGEDGIAAVDMINSSYTINIRSEYPDFIDRFLVTISNGLLLLCYALLNFALNAASTLRIFGCRDQFYSTMSSSVRMFYKAILSGTPPPISGEDGIVSLRYCDTIAKSIQLDWEQKTYQPDRPVIESSTKKVDVLVLGGTGFIGKCVTKQLISKNYSVRLLTRSPESLPSFLNDKETVQIVQGDIRNLDDLRRALEGVKKIVHLALPQGGGTWDSWKDSCVLPTKHLAEACLTSNIEKLVFASSIAVYYLGGDDGVQVIKENSPLDNCPTKRSYYSRAKIESEEILKKFHDKYHLPVIIVRPGIVVGEYGLIRHSGVGYWPSPNHCIGWEPGDYPLPLVLVEDVANAILLALERKNNEGASYNLVGDVRLTAREYVKRLSEISKRNIYFHPRPVSLVEASEILLWAVKVIARKSANTFPEFRDIKSHSHKTPFDCSWTKTELGWKPLSDRNKFIARAIEVHFLDHKD